MDIFLNDRVIVAESDGTIIGTNIKADVQRGMITIPDISLPLKTGCIISRALPSGVVEEFIVEDPGFSQGMPPAIPAAYSAKVRRKDALPAKPATVTYNVTGVGARVNIGSYDASHNEVVYTQGSSEELFARLKETAAAIPSQDREQIQKSIDEMEKSIGQPSFLDRYKEFMALAASHVIVFTPFYTALASLLPHAK